MEKQLPAPYCVEYRDRMLSFFRRPAFACSTTERYDRGGNVISAREERIPCEFPTFARFAAELGVGMTDLLSWRADPAFDHAYQMCEALQKSIVVENAMLGRYDSSFAKFYLTSEMDRAATEASPFSVEIRVVDA